MALVAAAAVAGTTLASMYLDGKYHYRKDLHAIMAERNAAAAWVKAVKENRQSLYYLFEVPARSLGNKECIWSREGCYSWTETYDRVNQYGQWYLLQGVKPGDLVSFYLQNSPDFIFAWLGLWSIGAAPAMINYNLAGKALLHCLKISGANIVLVDSDPDLAARIEGVMEDLKGELGMRRIVMDESTFAQIKATDSSRPDDIYREGVKGDWPMCLFYTSGTTGMPKGCAFDVARGFHVGIMRSLGNSLTEDHDRWYDCMPMYHGTGGATAVTQIMQGITLCIGQKFSTSKFWSEVHDSKATWITYVGETARYLLAAPPSPLDKDHNVRGMYGNGLRPDVWLKFRDRFGVEEVCEFFSSTEGVFGLVNRCKGDFFAGSVGHHGAIFRRLLHDLYVPVRVDEETGVILRNPKTGFAYRQPYDVGGEIIVKVPDEQCFPGYFKSPEATAKKFERDVFKKGDLYYRSGDALRRADDGRWYFLDRLGDTFRWKGENVSTAEVSEVIGKYPGVVEANVYGVLLPKHDGRAGCAAIYIDPAYEKNFDYSGLLKHTRTHLPKYAVPVFLRVVKEMTPIHNNKQNKVPLRQEGVDPSKVKEGDHIVWVPNGHHTYVPFEEKHWHSLDGGRSRI